MTRSSPALLLFLWLAGCGDEPKATWERDVLPIVQARCQACHVEGGIGPMPLVTYEDARPYAANMAEKVALRQMPPWMPSPECRQFKDERRLTQAEIDAIVAWKDAGAPQGDRADQPPVAAPRKELPWVDATLAMAESYIPSTAYIDDYRCFILDPQLAADRDVIGFDIVPGVRAMVHHVLLYSAEHSDALRLDLAEAGPGYTCFGGPRTKDPLVVGGWVPGTPVTIYPEGTGITLGKSKVLVMQIHYNTTRATPGVTADRTVVKLMYSPTRVPKPAYIIPQAQTRFVIPPGAVGYSVTDDYGPVPVPVVLWGVIPHMHTLGKSVKVEGIRDGATECWIDIPRWDFHWQQMYFYSAGIPVQAGDKVRLTCTWDNPTSHPVTWGEGTSDEMCLNYYYVSF